MPENAYTPSDTASPAPGRLEVVRAFLNTVDLEAEARGEQTERLGAWLAEGPLRVVLDEEALREVQVFREALREVAEVNAGHAPARPAWQALQPYASIAGFRMQIPPEGGLFLVPAGEGAARAIGEILAIVHQALLDQTWQRLKVCRKSSCRWGFYDRSKNASGAWCNMATCGNRVKAQRRRARQKTGVRFA